MLNFTYPNSLAEIKQDFLNNIISKKTAKFSQNLLTLQPTAILGAATQFQQELNLLVNNKELPENYREFSGLLQYTFEWINTVETKDRISFSSKEILNANTLKVLNELRAESLLLKNEFIAAIHCELEAMDTIRTNLFHRLAKFNELYKLCIKLVESGGGPEMAERIRYTADVIAQDNRKKEAEKRERDAEKTQKQRADELEKQRKDAVDAQKRQEEELLKQKEAEQKIIDSNNALREKQKAEDDARKAKAAESDVKKVYSVSLSSRPAVLWSQTDETKKAANAKYMDDLLKTPPADLHRQTEALRQADKEEARKKHFKELNNMSVEEMRRQVAMLEAESARKKAEVQQQYRRERYN